MQTDPQIAELAQLIAQSRRAVVFTGAGISTELGIPDFRSPGASGRGWRRSISAISSVPRRQGAKLGAAVSRWRKPFARPFRTAATAPSPPLSAAARSSAVITQNIDGLHQASGVPAEQVIELHGNTTYATCLDCDKRYELDAVRAAFERNETAPACEDCSGWVKTATISFGQAMPVEPMRRAEQETLAADLFIVLGSSLVVYPAAGFPELAKRSGAALIIVNREPTGLDRVADLVINRPIGETLATAVAID